MSRARRIASKVTAAPIATLVGVVVVPVLHVGLASGRLKTSNLIDAVEARTDAIDVDIDVGRRIADSVHLGARFWGLQDTSCVSRSLVCWALCREQGIDARIQIGMSPETRKAHAWVEIDGVPVDDTNDVSERFLPFDRAFTGMGRGR